MKENIVGTRIGIYDVLYECDFKSNDGHRMYHVKCIECGFETNMQKRHIGLTKICSHTSIDGNYKTYGIEWENNRIHKIFNGMKQRCYNEQERAYRWYGAKGIKICDEWLNNPKSFEEWSLQNGYADNLTIDRIKEEKDYSPDNCRWVTLIDNAKYKSTTSLIEVDGEVHTGKDWAKMLGLGINRINIYMREYGYDNTVNFIKKYIGNPGLKPKAKQSYYDLYMGM